jgi:inorganic triphosphatase YgiF
MLLIAGGIAAFVQNSATPMGRDELKISAADLRVMASAGSLLAEQYLDGRTTDTFYREQSSLLRDEARSAREDVEETDVVPGAEQQHDALVQLAKETENEIAALADFPQSAPSAEVNLRLIFGRLQALEAELKK